MTPDYNFYIDEAGHTGQDLLNSDQLFFSMSSLGIPVKHVGAVEEMVDRLKAAHKIDFELKGSKIIGTKFEPIIPLIFEELPGYSFLPVFTVLEKRFMVAAKIVEDFFDPSYNDNTDNSWTFPIPIKPRLANYYYQNLSDETIKIVSVAFRHRKLSDVESAYERIHSETLDEQFRRLFEGVRVHLSELSDTLCTVHDDEIDDLPGSVLNSPNYPIYYEHLQKIEHILRQRKLKANLVFDSSREFNAPFHDLLEKLKNAKETKIVFPNTVQYFGFKNIEAFESRDSKNDVCIQLADVMATSINSFFRKLAKTDTLWELTGNEEYWMNFIFLLLEHDFGNWVVSELLKKKYGRIIKEYAKK